MRLITMNRQARRLQRAAAARRRPTQAPFTVTLSSGPRDDSHLPFLPPVPPAAGAARYLMTTERKSRRHRIEDRRDRVIAALQPYSRKMLDEMVGWLSHFDFDPPAGAEMTFRDYNPLELAEALTTALAAIYHRSPQLVAEHITWETQADLMGRTRHRGLKLEKQLTIEAKDTDRVDAHNMMYGHLGGRASATTVLEHGIPMPDFDSRAIIERVTEQAQRIVDGRS